MKLSNMIGARPLAAAFGMRGGGAQSFTVARDAEMISLVSAGAETRLPAATQSDAGLLTASDKVRLDGVDELHSRLARIETTSMSSYNQY